jgi:hypothetical protein
VNRLLLDSKGRMWAATRGGLAGNEAAVPAESPDGTLWAGTDWGISRGSLGGDSPSLLRKITCERGLSDRTVCPRTACGRSSKTAPAS